MNDARELALSNDDLDRLARLRGAFLGTLERGQGPTPDYWRDTRDLELYDAFFGARIASKWSAALREVETRVGLPAGPVLVDFGCGTGIAARAWLARQGATRLHLWDRSTRAVAFAEARVRAVAPALEIARELPAREERIDVLLASHILSELDGRGTEALVALARVSRFVLWVEAGDRSTSRRLSAARDALLTSHEPVAPCTHASACGALAPGRGSDWCHFFAAPDPAVFRSRAWRQASERLGFDLRSLPYAFLALRGREAPCATDDPRLIRVLGRARAEKGAARFTACARAGLLDLRFLERDGPSTCKALCEPGQTPLVFRARVDGDRARALERPGPPGEAETLG